MNYLFNRVLLIVFLYIGCAVCSANHLYFCIYTATPKADDYSAKFMVSGVDYMKFVGESAQVVTVKQGSPAGFYCNDSDLLFDVENKDGVFNLEVYDNQTGGGYMIVEFNQKGDNGKVFVRYKTRNLLTCWAKNLCEVGDDQKPYDFDYDEINNNYYILYNPDHAS